MENSENGVSSALELFRQENMLGNYKLDEVSLVIPDGMAFEQVESMLMGLKVVSDSIRFWLGDLLVYSERNYGEKYAQLVDATDYSYQGLCDMMWVANSVAPNVRRKELTWSHHREVAKLDMNRQVEYLETAVKMKMSVADLHALIDEKEKAPKKEGPTKVQAYEDMLKEIVKLTKSSKFFVVVTDLSMLTAPEDKSCITQLSEAEAIVTGVAMMSTEVLKEYRK